MIWSDMVFRVGSKTNDYYDRHAVIPDEVVAKMSPEVELVYWDYYHADSAFYEEWIRRHRAMGKEPIFAAGAWSWGRFWAFEPRWQESLSAGMKAARDQKLREVFLTVWGDDGAECHPVSLLPAVQSFSEWAYVEEPVESTLERQFTVLSQGGTREDCRLASEIDAVPATRGASEADANFGKWLLWHDPVLGFFNRHIPPDLPKHYRLLAEKLDAQAAAHDADGNNASPIHFAALVARALAAKSELHIKTRPAYEAGDRKELRRLLDEVLPETQRAIGALWDTHRAVWNQWHKPFGWEVLDVRYGGITARLESLKLLLQEHLADSSARIAEFEFPLLSLPDFQSAKSYFSYARTATPSVIR